MHVFHSRDRAMPTTEERVERRLTAILAADVVGYSRLMEIDEEGTLATLKGMNFNMGDVADALKLTPTDGPAAGAKQAQPSKGGKAGPAAPLVDPLQWWGSLTTQFQQIAADAFKDAARPTDGSHPKDAAKAPAQPRKTAARTKRAK